MFTASKKKKENIAEYLLYMWQMEDLIRANNLEMENIEENIISRYSGYNEEQLKSLRNWYESLIDMMKREGVADSGHLQLNKNIILQLNDLHKRLLSDSKFARYNTEFYQTLPYIIELRAKAKEKAKDEIETCFDALYGILMLKLSKKEISEETLAASRQISKFLSLLSYYYKLDYNNELETVN